MVLVDHLGDGPGEVDILEHQIADGGVLLDQLELERCQAIRFGEDLMSRVSYAIMHPDGIAEMTEVVRAALNELIQEAATEANIDPDLILSIAAAGNPIMHHFMIEDV